MLAPWKKSNDNLDSVLKSKDITFTTKIHRVKAMIFPVVIYGCESRTTIQKPEHKSLVVEGSGTPLQYSCLENPMDGGAW